MPNKNDKHIIYSSEAERPSRFLVDLKKVMADGAGGEQWPRSPLQRTAGLLSAQWRCILKELYKNFLHIIGKTSRRARSFYLFLDSRSARSGRPEGKIIFFKNEKFRRLTFFPLLTALVKFFLAFVKAGVKLCFWTGWLAIFCVRFVVLLNMALFRAVVGRGVNIGRYLGVGLLVLAVFLRRKRGSARKIFCSFGGKLFRLPTPHLNWPFFCRRFWGKGVELPPKSHFSELYLGEGKNKKLFCRSGRPAGELFKPILFFVLALVIIILPVKIFSYYMSLHGLHDRVLGVSEAAVDELRDASALAVDFDFSRASQGFSRASRDFIVARNEIKEVNGLLAVLGVVVPVRDVKMAAQAELILGAGRQSAELGRNLSLAAHCFFSGGVLSVKNMVENCYDYLGRADEAAGNLDLKLKQIKPQYLPEEYQKNFIALRKKSDIIKESLDELAGILAEAKVFLGFDMPRRYLLVFQNNAEMRASGGFVGSFALMDIAGGEIKNIEAPAGGSYDTEAGLYERIAAPEPLDLVNPLWHFWDANWWPDWPMSARKLAWFYERSGGPTVDGVIGLTPTVVERILKAIGPVDMRDQYNVILSADNFWPVIETFSEQKPVGHPQYSPNPYLAVVDSAATFSSSAAAKPKKIIGDLFRKLINELPQSLNKDTALKLVNIFEQCLAEKHILFYFNNPDLQAKAEELGWDGRVRKTAGDYLMVVNTNIGGGKSDRKIREKIEHTAEVGEDGSIIDTVIVKRTHTGNKSERFSGVRNVDWMRIYVPLGSELIEAGGFLHPEDRFFSAPEAGWRVDSDIAEHEAVAVTDRKSNTKIYNESGKTVFANWSMVDPGETAVVYVKYKLPFALKYMAGADNWLDKIGGFFNPEQKKLVPYSLLAQKQPGSLGSGFTGILRLPSVDKIVWKYPTGVEAVKSGGWLINDSLKTDKYWAVLVENRGD